VNTTKQNTKKGTTKYSKDKIRFLLMLLESKTPNGPMAWNDVTTDYAEQFPQKNRSTKSLHQKLRDLSNTPKPTGNKSCLSFVSHAIAIGESMIAKYHGKNLDPHILAGGRKAMKQTQILFSKPDNEEEEEDDDDDDHKEVDEDEDDNNDDNDNEHFKNKEVPKKTIP